MAWMAMMGELSVEYHRATIVGRADDYPGRALAYYGSRGETPLMWGGSGAARLGLQATMTDAQYTALFGAGGAADPTSGVRLVATRRPGMELVVSAHKSVAELGVIGGAEDMHQILDAERDATLAFLDQATRQRGGRRGRQRTPAPTGGMIYAHTRHATSRAGDPCPHDHVLVANVVEMADPAGGWKAADTALWRDQLHAATMVGRVAAAWRAVELGYAIVPDAGRSGRLGHWRIAGIPDAVLKLHSKRGDEIDVHVESRGFGSARARSVAARETRKAKRFEPVGRLMARWQRELCEIGVPPAELAESVRSAGREAGRPLGPMDPVELDLLVERALSADGELARRKVFGRAEAIVAVAPQLFGRPVAELDRAIERLLADREVIPLVGVPGARDRCYSLARVIATEHAIARQVAEATAIGGAAVLSQRLVDTAIAVAERRLGGPLTAGQVAAIRGICSEGRRISLVLGVAGSGKTTALAAVADAYRAAGYQLVGTATAGQAARTLAREADMPARTLASLRWQLDHGRLRLDSKTVVVVDEAGATDDADLLYVLSAAKIAQAKVVLIGDDHQLGPVGPGGALGALLDRHSGLVHVLDDNVRQVDPAEREALAELRAGDVAAAVGWYASHNRIALSGDWDDAIAATVDAWAAAVSQGRDAVMLAWRRASVEQLNGHARQAWADMGRLDGPELIAPGGRRYQAGDRIVTLAPAPDGSLVTSAHGTVTAVNPAAGALIARMDDGALHRLEGDQLAAERLDYAYALTVHRCQGSTVEVCHHLADGGGRELAYVAMSRSRTSTIVHAVADDLDQAIEDLTQQWGHQRRPRWAIDQGSPDHTLSTPQRSGPVRIISEETARQLGQLVERARLQAERDALAAAIPADPTRTVQANRDRQRQLQAKLDQLHQGRYQGPDPELAEASDQLQYAAQQRSGAAYVLAVGHPGWRVRRQWTRQHQQWTNAETVAAEHWRSEAQPEMERITGALVQLAREQENLRQQQTTVTAWWDQHPEARSRLAALDYRLRTIDSPSPAIQTIRGIDLARSQARRIEHEPPRRDHGRGLGR